MHHCAADPRLPPTAGMDRTGMKTVAHLRELLTAALAEADLANELAVGALISQVIEMLEDSHPDLKR